MQYIDKVSNDNDYELWRLFNFTRDLIGVARKKELEEIEITPRQVAVLYAIVRIGNNATPVEISRLLRREPNTISDILYRMVKKGLIQQSKDLPHKHMIRVFLTEKGMQAYMLSASRRSIHRIFAYLTNKECKQLELLLNKLALRAYEEITNND